MWETIHITILPPHLQWIHLAHTPFRTRWCVSAVQPYGVQRCRIHRYVDGKVDDGRKTSHIHISNPFRLFSLLCLRFVVHKIFIIINFPANHWSYRAHNGKRVHHARWFPMHFIGFEGDDASRTPCTAHTHKLTYHKIDCDIRMAQLMQPDAKINNARLLQFSREITKNRCDVALTDTSPSKSNKNDGHSMCHVE